jgi:hypothetical protein
MALVPGELVLNTSVKFEIDLNFSNRGHEKLKAHVLSDRRPITS